MTVRMVLRQLRRIMLTAFFGGLLGATLIRLSPGFGIDERDMDTRANHASKEEARAQYVAERNIGTYYLRYLSQLVHGELGVSHALNRPVAELIRQRLPLTLESLACGVAVALMAGFSVALLGVVVRSQLFDM